MIDLSFVEVFNANQLRDGQGRFLLQPDLWDTERLFAELDWEMMKGDV